MSFLNIVCATDSGYARHLGAMLVSLLDNAEYPGKIRIYLIGSNLQPGDVDWLGAIVKQRDAGFCFIEFDLSRVEGYPESGHINKTSYLRLYVHLLLPRDVLKCIYLDCDLIVLDRIEKLWTVDLEGRCIGAVREDQLGRDLSGLGVSDASDYFNAGVLLIDLVLWRELDVHETFDSFVKSRCFLLEAHDQDVLNVCLQGKVFFLDEAWNLTRRSAFRKYTYLYLGLKKYYPSIVHYTSDIKPWGAGDLHPLAREYWRYLGRAGWSGCRRKRDLTGLGLYHRLRLILRGWR